MNSINKEKALYTIINSDLQKSNDKVIQNFLNHFKHYAIKEELKTIDIEIISEKVLKPDLILHNKIFDKNNCFYESNNILKKNYFPRQIFKLNLSSDNSEENSSIKFESKNSSDSLESKKNEEISEDKNGSSEEEEEEEDEEEENVEIRTNPVDYENNYNNNNFINEYNNYNNNPQQISNKKQAMQHLFNSNEKFLLNFIKLLNNMNNINLRGGNKNLEQKNEALFTLFENNMDYPGWRIKIMKNGFINKNFRTFELFDFLTGLITKNLRLDNFFIFNETTNDSFKGGIFYFVLKSFLMNYFNSQNKQIEQMKYFLQFNQLNNFKENNNNYSNEDMQEDHQLSYITNGYLNNNNNDYQSFGFNA